MSTHLTPASAVVFNESSAALNFIMINRDQFTIREFMALIHIETNTSQNLLAAIYSEAADRSRSKVLIEIEAKLKKQEAQRRLDAERLKIKKSLILSYSNPIASGSPAAFPVPAMGSVTTPGGSTTVPNYSFNSHLLNPVSSPFVPTVNQRQQFGVARTTAPTTRQRVQMLHRRCLGLPQQYRPRQDQLHSRRNGMK